MKNIHTLQTDKPSRLWTNNLRRRLELDEFPESHPTNIAKHIYITNDEEIKEGDWMYYKHFGEDIICEYDTMGGQNTNVNEHKDYYKKIILTTDGDLIKDGVQAIDDEFLEWFVKNPSCEEVEVIKEDVEQPKPLYPNGNHKGERVWIETYKIIIPKQETIEEAAERLYPISGEYFDREFYMVKRIAFKNGAKWQQERMYSEEDLLSAFEAGMMFIGEDKGSFKEWFEQNKKK